MAEATDSVRPGGGHRLSLNEMPDVPVADLGEVLNSSLREVNRYPDPFSRELTASLARVLSVPENEV